MSPWLKSLSDAKKLRISSTIAPDDDRLEALAEFAAGAGHEINNPVFTIVARVELLLRGETDPQRRHWLSIIGGQAERIRDMIGDAMLFGRPPEEHPESLDLAAEIKTVLDRLAERVDRQGCTLVFHSRGDVSIWADRVQLSIVISSLVSNSLNALADGGPISIDARMTEDESARPTSVISVTDHGSGLNETDLRHLFDPFYSGRQAGRGLGFGLPKCWRIVSNHQGQIEVSSAPGEATTFTVYWPATAPPDDTASAQSQESS